MKTRMRTTELVPRTILRRVQTNVIEMDIDEWAPAQTILYKHLKQNEQGCREGHVKNHSNKCSDISIVIQGDGVMHKLPMPHPYILFT